MLLLKNWMNIKPKLLKFVFPKEICFSILIYFLSMFFYFRLSSCLLSCSHTHFTVFCWDPVLIAPQTRFDFTLMLLTLIEGPLKVESILIQMAWGKPLQF